MPSTPTGALTGPPPLPPKIPNHHPHMPGIQGSFIHSFKFTWATVPKKTCPSRTAFQTPLACQFRQILIPMLRCCYGTFTSRCIYIHTTHFARLYTAPAFSKRESYGEPITNFLTDLDEAQPIVISPWGEKKKNYKNRARGKKKKTGATGPFFVPLTKMPRYREMTMTKKKKKKMGRRSAQGKWQLIIVQ